MSRRRIFYILGSLAANDVGDEVVTILGRLSRSEFEPRVVALGTEEELRGRIVDMKVRVYTLGLSGALGTWQAVRRVRELFRTLGGDLAHGFGSWGGSVAQLGAPKGAGVVRTLLGPLTDRKDLSARVLRHMERRARRRIHTRFVVRNEAGRDLAARSFGADDARVTILPAAIDVEAVRGRVRGTRRDEARRLMGIAPHEFAFVLITDFESDARMDAILDGFATAARERRNLRLFLVGSGRHEGSTRWKAEELSLGDSVVFLGSAADRERLWACADAAVEDPGHPAGAGAASMDAAAAAPGDGWSRSALVAMAAGIPTVRRRDGVADWLDASDGRPLEISGHPDRFAVELVRLAGDRELRARLAARGRALAGAVDVGDVVGRLGDLYRSVSVASPMASPAIHTKGR